MAPPTLAWTADRARSGQFGQRRIQRRHAVGVDRDVDALSGETFETKNPATGTSLATLPRGRAEDVDAAVRSARRARGISLRRFYLRRTMRIFPAYYVFVATLVALTALGAFAVTSD